MSAPLPASWVLIPCPECDGEGFVLQEMVGGHFDAYQEAWYPLERVMTCGRCGGACEVEVSYDEELRVAA